MNMRFSLSLAGLVLLSTLSGCAAMLPIAGALVLKEAADRYEASNKPKEAEKTVAAVPEDAATETDSTDQDVEAQPPRTTRVASTRSSKPRPIAHTEPMASAAPEDDSDVSDESDVSESEFQTTEETEEVVKTPPPQQQQQQQQQRQQPRQPAIRSAQADPAPAPAPAKANRASNPSLTSNRKNAGPKSASDPANAGKQKADAAIKTAKSIPTNEAAAAESATDSAARILATTLKRIPNPQPIPATKPMPITPQKAN